MSTTADSVEVRLFGPLRQAVGQKSVVLPYAGLTMKDALSRFAEDQGDSVRPMLFDVQGNRLRSIILLLNDETIDDDLRLLQRGDVISVLLPLAGG